MKKLWEKLKNKLFIQPIDDDERYYLSKVRTDCIVLAIMGVLVPIGFVIFAPFDFLFITITPFNSISTAVSFILVSNLACFCLVLVYKRLFVKWILFRRKWVQKRNDMQKN